MELPRIFRIALNIVIFLLLLLAIAGKINWQGIVVIGILIYIGFRFMFLNNHHRFTAMPMAAIFILITIFGVLNMQAIALLIMAMLLDSFV